MTIKRIILIVVLLSLGISALVLILFFIKNSSGVTPSTSQVEKANTPQEQKNVLTDYINTYLVRTYVPANFTQYTSDTFKSQYFWGDSNTSFAGTIYMLPTREIVFKTLYVKVNKPAALSQQNAEELLKKYLVVQNDIKAFTCSTNGDVIACDTLIQTPGGNKVGYSLQTLPNNSFVILSTCLATPHAAGYANIHNCRNTVY